MKTSRLLPTAIVALAAIMALTTPTSAGPPRASVKEYVYVTHRAPAPPLGACTAPQDADSTSAFSLAPWQIGSTMSLTLSTLNVPSSVGTGAFATALSNAAGEWEGTQLGNAFGSVTQQSVRARQRLDGSNMVAFGKIGSAVGATRFWIDTGSGDVVEFDVMLNPNYPWSTALNGNVEACSGTSGSFDVEAVLVHELGHPVGLEHVANDVQTMEPVVGTGETRKRTLANGDTTGANTKY